MNEDGIKKLFAMVDVLSLADLRNLAKLLWKQREFFKKTFDIMRDSVVVINGDGEIFYCNAQARELLAIAESSPSHTLWEYIPEFVSLADFSSMPMAGGCPFLSKEIKVSYPQRRILNVAVTASGGDDERLFVFRICDITDERSATEKNISDEKIASVMLLASGIAHEIGNPLNAISLRLQLMQKQMRAMEDADCRQKLEISTKICLDEISRLDGIVKNFLHAIRPQKPNFCDASLGKILGTTIALMEGECQALNVKIINNAGDLPLILGDASQLKQVFFNLLKNALEAVSDGGTIAIGGDFTDDSVILTFADDGAGIACECVDKIFQPYFSTKSDGSGLGMVIVERILRAHDATITIASAQNVGTKISLNFPRKDRRIPFLGQEPAKFLMQKDAKLLPSPTDCDG
jgi:signal transduction histidine kinase